MNAKKVMRQKLQVNLDMNDVVSELMNPNDDGHEAGED